MESRQRPKKPVPWSLEAASPVESGVRRFRLRLPVKWFRSSDDRSDLLRSRSGRLSGLLSGCPPTDTRPQARAKLGNCAHKRCARALQEFFSEMPSAVHRERAARRVARPPAPSAARDEGLDALRVAQERDHHGDAADEEDALHDVLA